MISITADNTMGRFISNFCDREIRHRSSEAAQKAYPVYDLETVVFPSIRLNAVTLPKGNGATSAGPGEKSGSRLRVECLRADYRSRRLSTRL